MRRLLFRGGLLVFAFGLPGCSGEAKPVGDEELALVENATGTAAYYAGRSFAGLELTHAESPGAGRALFVYGSCEIDDPDGFFGPEGGSCAPPVQIQVFRFDPHQWALAVGCHRHPSLVVLSFTQDVVATVQNSSEVFARPS